MSDSNFSRTETIERPLVVIAGRPNVGKSTLFNRITGKRKAITDPTPGVTRDPLAVDMERDGVPFTLMDTGGYKLEQEGLDGLVTQRSLEVIEQARLVILLLDVTEVTGEDETFMERLRPYAHKIFLAVNKVDSPEREAWVWNYYSYGFANVFPISAAHGLGCAQLLDETVAYLRELPDASPAAGEEAFDIKLAILGKPNTGKSTLLNALTDSNLSIVSDIPGTTRDVIEGAFQYQDLKIQVLDTAGIRRKKKVVDDVEYYSVNRAIKSIEQSDVVLLMIDSLDGLSEQDKKIASLIVRRGKGVVIVLNKWDLQQDLPNQFEAVQDRLRFLFPILEFAPVVPLSALQRDGLGELLKAVRTVWKQLQIRVETPQLNKHLKAWVEENEPPRWNRGRYKIRYAVQTGTMPLAFVFFVNRRHGFPEFYERYLLNRIRKDFGMTKVPVAVYIREK